MKKRTKDIVLVVIILGVILGVNIGIYLNYKRNIQTNYYKLPSPEQLNNKARLEVYVYLEKKFENDDPYFLRLGLLHPNETEVAFCYLEEQRFDEEENKFQYLGNFTRYLEDPGFYGELETNVSYKFFLHFRAWSSRPVNVHPDGYFIWEGKN